MRSPASFTIHVQQPTVPHYRVPFFDAVSERVGGRLNVSASRSVLDGPASADVQRDYLDLEHDCLPMLKNNLFWQRNMALGSNAVPGDVAVICANPRYLSTLKFVALARRRGMGVVWWGHGWSPTSRQWATSMRKALMHGVDAVLLYSDAEAAEWRPRLPKNISVVGAQNAIDQSNSRKLRAYWTSERLLEFRRDQALEGRKVLLFCGRLRTCPYTGVDLLLHALARLKQYDSSYLAVIIGDGGDQPRLRELANRLGVDTHVRWLGAQFEEAVTAPWFLSALCFTYPGPIGLSILHAMGYGLPVITHDDRRRHNPEIVTLQDGWNGLMFRDGDASDLATKISSLAHSIERQDSLSANALITAHEHYTLDNMVDRFLLAVEHAHRRARHGGGVLAG